MGRISREKILTLLVREEEKFASDRPKSRQMFERAKEHFIGGAPMSWMRIWMGGFPVFVEKAEGATLWDVDGNRYVDLCLGDTGALCGHAHPEVTKALNEQFSKGITHMLPTEDSLWVGEELTRRFGLPYWQILMTASDANRMALKAAREVTGRKLILAFNFSYHGSVDETLCVSLMGNMMHIPGAMGPIVANPASTTRIVEFNDMAALEKALEPRDIACVITEPVMTNVGIIYPDPGFHDALREITERTGTLLLIDETHCICGGPAGMTGEWGLKPDILVLGKPVAGGFPAAVLGFNETIAKKLSARIPWHMFFGFGGTLSGNAAAVAGVRAALTHALTRENFDRMIPIAQRMENGIAELIKEFELGWYVARIGCRVEFRFLPNPPKKGSDTLNDAPYNSVDIFNDGLSGPLEKLIHVYCANRGILLTPVHEMALVGPDTTVEDVNQYVSALRNLIMEIA
jgi:glutamate-1-semialdehyde 2,1-aminomutase